MCVVVSVPSLAFFLPGRGQTSPVANRFRGGGRAAVRTCGGVRFPRGLVGGLFPACVERPTGFLVTRLEWQYRHVETGPPPLQIADADPEGPAPTHRATRAPYQSANDLRCVAPGTTRRTAGICYYRSENWKCTRTGRFSSLFFLSGVLWVRGEIARSNRGRRGTLLARRDDEAYRRYVEEACPTKPWRSGEQRSRKGCIGVRIHLVVLKRALCRQDRNNLLVGDVVADRAIRRGLDDERTRREVPRQSRERGQDAFPGRLEGTVLASVAYGAPAHEFEGLAEGVA